MEDVLPRHQPTAPLNQLVVDERERLRARLRAAGVLDRLDADSQERLCVLVWETDRRFATFLHLPSGPMNGEDAKCRMLHSKVARVTAAIDDVLSYATRLTDSSARNLELSDFVESKVRPDLDKVKAAVALVAARTEHIAKDWDFGEPIVTNPEPEATRALLSFFDECGLDKGDARWRAGTIGNRLMWWKPVKTRARTESADRPRGAEAMRKRDTRRKKSR